MRVCELDRASVILLGKKPVWPRIICTNSLFAIVSKMFASAGIV